MGIISDGAITIFGNFAPITNERPKSIDEDYKVMVPFDFKWREKIGKVECDCKEVLECYQPYYGFDWYHSKDCSLVKLVEEKPQLKNLWCYSHLPHLASSE